MRWVPQKREAGERIGQNDKRKEGKLIGEGGSAKR